MPDEQAIRMPHDRLFKFHQLSFLPEGEEVVVGRPDTGSFAVLPADGAELLHQLFEGMPPEQAAEWYENTFGEAVDIADFLDSLADLGFLRSDEESSAVPAKPRFQRLGQILFAPPAWLTYGFVVIWWAWTVAQHHDLRPVASQVFFTSSLVVVQLTIVAAQAPLTLLHESFHVLAGQRLGLSSTLKVSNRWANVVFETRSNGLFSVPRRRRYLPFLAGMLMDVLLLAALDLLANSIREPSGVLSLPGRLSVALAFTLVVRIAWQFQFFLRTDLYFVLATALNCYDLHDASKALMKNRISRLLGRTTRLIDESQWTEHDKRVGNLYGWFLLIGAATVIGVTCLVSIPVFGTYLRHQADGLFSGRFDASFWDSLTSAAMNACVFLLPVYLSRRKRREDAHRRPRLLAEVESSS
jgi:hypothetical protein